MVSVEAFSDLLHTLYEPPLQHERWERFPTLVIDHTASRNGFFSRRIGPGLD
jgi:hypothetical protein